ncbi:MAG TPA: hypothetical protein PKV80_28135 [Leptospiraceae bacterium]|nr:hypothetical protein [Leptospiraceae bacterium]HNF28366.1 hypothetical protein [Leptospiraceae bacterium]HNO26857.1 hypothetical protein [Leptospiraceae bacterium]
MQGGSDEKDYNVFHYIIIVFILRKQKEKRDTSYCKTGRFDDIVFFYRRGINNE